MPRRRERGDIDVVDLIVGVVLLVLVPILCYVVGRSFLTTKSEKRLFRQELDIPPPPVDKEEVEQRLATFRGMYEKNAKSYIDTMEEVADGMLKEHHRAWAERCLANAHSNLGELANDIKSYPTTKSQFTSHLQQIETLQGRIEVDLKHVRSLDILGRSDAGRRTASERELLNSQ